MTLIAVGPEMSASARRPVWALHVLIVGLALHNLVMSQLYRAGVRGSALTVIAAWKDVLLLVALAARRACRAVVCRSRRAAVDWLALAFAAFVVVYGADPAVGARRRRDAQGRALRRRDTTCCRCARTSSAAAST